LDIPRYCAASGCFNQGSSHSVWGRTFGEMGQPSGTGSAIPVNASRNSWTRWSGSRVWNTTHATTVGSLICRLPFGSLPLFIWLRHFRSYFLDQTGPHAHFHEVESHAVRAYCQTGAPEEMAVNWWDVRQIDGSVHVQIIGRLRLAPPCDPAMAEPNDSLYWLTLFRQFRLS
jgi:hypothetical protein